MNSLTQRKGNRMAWRYIKKYIIAEAIEVEDLSGVGYEPVGGAVISNGQGYQAMALYDDEVTLAPLTESTE